MHAYTVVNPTLFNGAYPQESLLGMQSQLMLNCELYVVIQISY